jgi:hypothetical protein
MIRPESFDRAHVLHDALVDARKRRRRLDHQIAGLIRDIADERLFEVFGHASIVQYGEAEHGLSPRQTHDYLLLGRKLTSLPAIDNALSAGELDKTKARELLRVATPETESAWVARALASTSRALEADIAVSRPGDPPPDDGAPSRGPARVRRTFTLDAAEAELLDQALLVLRLQTGVERDDLEDGVLLAIAARKILADADASESPRGGEPTRMIVQTCPDCASARSGDSEISDTLVDEALCDALITSMEPGPAQGHVSRAIPPAVRTAVLCAFDLKCAVPGCRHRWFLDVHHVQERRRGGDHRRENLVPLCPAHHRIVHGGVLAIERSGATLVFLGRRGALGVTTPRWGP